MSLYFVTGINSAQFKERKQSLTKELKKINKKYKVLQQKRKFELQAVRSELSNLRETVKICIKSYELVI